MRSQRACLVATLAAVAAAGTAATARAEAKYVIDPEHSTVIFKVKNRDVSYIFGRFNKLSGVITVDRLSDPSRFDINVEIKSKSLDTNNKKRDRDLTGAKFFNAAAHPKITFEGTTTRGLEDKKFELTGKLGFLGATTDLTVIIRQTGLERISRAEFRLGIESTFTINRSELGMEHMIPDIADEVTVIVNLEGRVELKPAG